jgi:DNA/RNA endonuclease YhcR with UshA esterase domain
MKIKPALILFLLSPYCKAQTVSPDSAKYHEGSLTKVCGELTSGKISESENIYLNFGAPYPDNSFTAVIFAKDSANFKEIRPKDYLKKKNICVTGIIKMYNGKAEIIVKSPDQLHSSD